MLLLSEAIRIGAMLSPQGFNTFDDDGRTCALGAATEAAGLPIVANPSGPGLPTRPKAEASSTAVYVPDQWAMVLRREEPCPDCGTARLVSVVIPHLNDDHRWTRERIAVEFVEPIERAMGLWNGQSNEKARLEIDGQFAGYVEECNFTMSAPEAVV